MQKEGMAFWKHRLSHNNVHVQERLKVHQNTSGTLQFLQDEASSIKPQGVGMDDLFRKMLSFYQQYFCCFYHYYFQICKKEGFVWKKNVLCQQKEKSDSFVVRRVQWWVNHLLRKTISSIPYFFLFDRIEITDIVWYNFHFSVSDVINNSLMKSVPNKSTFWKYLPK